MATTKITKAMVLSEIMAQVENMNLSGEVTAEDVKAFCETSLAQLNAKNVKARERAAKKREESDGLKATVLAALTQEPKTGEQILAELNIEGLTKPMVVARLAQLINAEQASKETIKVDKRNITVYRRV